MYEYDDLLDEIKEETEVLWNKVLRKYGAHSYSLGVNGLREVTLSKGYTWPPIARGQDKVQEKLRELLEA